MLRNFLLIAHDVIESAIGGRSEKITPLVLLRLSPCGKRNKYKKAIATVRAARIKYHKRWPHAFSKQQVLI